MNVRFKIAPGSYTVVRLTVLTKFQQQHGHLECHMFLWPLDCTVKCLASHYIHSVALAVRGSIPDHKIMTIL